MVLILYIMSRYLDPYRVVAGHTHVWHLVLETLGLQETMGHLGMHRSPPSNPHPPIPDSAK